MRGTFLHLILLQLLFCGCSNDEETSNDAAATSSSTGKISQGDVDPHEELKKQLPSIVIMYTNSVDSNHRCDSIEDLKFQMPEENWGDNELQMFAAIESGEIVVR